MTLPSRPTANRSKSARQDAARRSASLASFDFSGACKVAIHSKRPAGKAKILPASFGIVPAIEGDTIALSLDRPCNLTIEVDGIQRVLHLFANPWKPTRPSRAMPE